MPIASAMYLTHLQSLWVQDAGDGMFSLHGCTRLFVVVRSPTPDAALIAVVLKFSPQLTRYAHVHNCTGCLRAGTCGRRPCLRCTAVQKHSCLEKNPSRLNRNLV